MAWNKSLQEAARDRPEFQEKTYRSAGAISVGAPVSYQLNEWGGRVGAGYTDGWDIAKAYKQGVASVTWVFRCIDVIASNQAGLPMVLRKDNSPFGEVVREHEILKLLNSTANHGESAWQFRYRLSSQILISTRGAFIEIVRNKLGNPIALHLLPPDATAPIPDVEKFVKGFEVQLGQGKKKTIAPENVIWIRRPHPLDPYLSMTPLEASGVAVELENLAKVYNRNFLINDGRPGGLLVLRSEVDEDDKNELQSRFAGNLGRAGAVGVISSEDGADFVDTAASPRDAAYVQMRTITKEEILAAFGVPESIIGNSSNRTFSNAMEEGKVFWMETMIPHLNLIARPFDKLDDKHFVDFDKSTVPILILSKQEQEKHHLEEHAAGLISVNEYRDATGRKKVESDLADSLLSNPNQTPIANTEKPMEQNVAQEGVSLETQATAAQQEQVTEYSPEEGAFVPAGTVAGTQDIEKPASEVPSEIEGSGEAQSRPLAPSR